MTAPFWRARPGAHVADESRLHGRPQAAFLLGGRPMADRLSAQPVLHPVPPSGCNRGWNAPLERDTKTRDSSPGENDAQRQAPCVHPRVQAFGCKADGGGGEGGGAFPRASCSTRPFIQLVHSFPQRRTGGAAAGLSSAEGNGGARS